LSRKAVVSMLGLAVTAATRRRSSLTGGLAALVAAAALLIPGAGVATAAPAPSINAFSFLPGPGLPSFAPCSLIGEFITPHVFQQPVQETGGAIDQFRFPVAETQNLISDFALFAESCLPVAQG